MTKLLSPEILSEASLDESEPAVLPPIAVPVTFAAAALCIKVTSLGALLPLSSSLSPIYEKHFCPLELGKYQSWMALDPYGLITTPKYISA